jgi:hypothetical protein
MKAIAPWKMNLIDYFGNCDGIIQSIEYKDANSAWQG